MWHVTSLPQLARALDPGCAPTVAPFPVQHVLRVPPEHRLHPQEVQSQIHPILMFLYVKNVVTGSGFGKAFQPHSCQEQGNQHRHFKTSHILPSNKPLCAVVRFFCFELFIFFCIFGTAVLRCLSLSLYLSLSRQKRQAGAHPPPLPPRACARARQSALAGLGGSSNAGFIPIGSALHLNSARIDSALKERTFGHPPCGMCGSSRASAPRVFVKQPWVSPCHHRGQTITDRAGVPLLCGKAWRSLESKSNQNTIKYLKRNGSLMPMLLTRRQYPPKVRNPENQHPPYPFRTEA